MSTKRESLTNINMAEADAKSWVEYNYVMAAGGAVWHKVSHLTSACRIFKKGRKITSMYLPDNKPPCFHCMPKQRKRYENEY